MHSSVGDFLVLFCRESRNFESMRTEPKFIVFLSQLLLLFNTCPTCKSDEPFIETSVIGTMVKVKTQCLNPHCPLPINTWRSQPIMTGTKMAAMNFLLCFSALVSGASSSKTFLVFRNRHDSMGHSAKYCAYTLFCCTVPLILDFSLIQVGKIIESYCFPI